MRELRLLKHKLAMMSIRTLLCILSVASTTYVRSLRQTCIEHDPEGSGAKEGLGSFMLRLHSILQCLDFPFFQSSAKTCLTTVDVKLTPATGTASQ